MSAAAAAASLRSTISRLNSGTVSGPQSRAFKCFAAARSLGLAVVDVGSTMLDEGGLLEQCFQGVVNKLQNISLHK